MALLILALLQRIFLMSSLMLLLVWLIFFMVLIKLLPILGTISGKSVDRKSGSAGMPRPISYAVFCLKKKTSSVLTVSLVGITVLHAQNPIPPEKPGLWETRMSQLDTRGKELPSL